MGVFPNHRAPLRACPLKWNEMALPALFGKSNNTGDAIGLQTETWAEAPADRFASGASWAITESCGPSY